MKRARSEIIEEHQVKFMSNKGNPLLAKKYPRNLPCWCGSGKKCKFCYGNETQYFQPKKKIGDDFLDVANKQSQKAMQESN